MDNKNRKQSGPGQQGEKKNQGSQPRKNEPTAQKVSDQHRKEQGSKAPSGQSQRPGSESAPTATQQSGQSNQTITNQDQQRQATNAGSSDKPMGEEETEGDRQREERLKPYKNVGDDSGETEKKSPTMK